MEGALPDVTTLAETPLWKPSRGRQFVETLFQPLIWLLNRPAAAPLSRRIYDFALRCNGMAIATEGSKGVTYPEERFLRRVVGSLQGQVLLDVGANCGSYAAFLARIAPTAMIYAFEPHPATFSRLVAMARGTRVQPLQLALGNRAGSACLYDFRQSDGSTQASLDRGAVEIFDKDIVQHEVVATTLDEFLAMQGIEQVAFLKIDTEGFDLKVLQGAAQAIAARRIKLIQFEFIPANIATHVRMRDFFEALPGYNIYRLCLNGELLPLFPYDVKFCEIYVTQNLVAKLR
jgi:FkbM family methyltransferase